MLQVRFALSSSPVFSRTDTTTDSERFYTSVIDLFEDVEEKEEVDDLLTGGTGKLVFSPQYAIIKRRAGRSSPITHRRAVLFVKTAL
jgi:hypothetical protein